MSTGKTHSGISTGTALGVLIGAGAASSMGLEATVLAASGALLGVVLTPDLDVDERCISHYYIRKFFGRIAEMWWYWLWHPYSLAMSHRGFWSHFPVISTLLRLTYMLFPVIIIPFNGRILPTIQSQIAAIPLWALAAILVYILGVDVIFLVLGLILSDVLHFIADHF